MSVQAIQLPYLIPDMPSAEETLPFLREIDSNRWYTNFGPLVLRLNEQVRAQHFAGQDAHTLLCSTGTAALELGLACLGLKPGARVLVPAFTFPASANAIENCGFEPVFCDVDEQSWVLTPEIAFEALQRTRIDAVMPVAALGRPLPASQWDRFSEQTGLPVLIDAAPALGSQRVGKRLVVAYSMHATKAFGIGEGGVLASANADLIARARQMCNFGMNGVGQVGSKGTNCKLSEYHAAVGLAQMVRWPARQLKRARIETAYQAHMQLHADLWAMQSFVDQPPESDVLMSLPGSRPRSTMPVRFSKHLSVNVQAVQHQLAERGIGTRLWYNPGLHRHPHFAACRQVHRPGLNSLATVDSLNQRLIGLPFHNFLTLDDIAYIVSSLWQIVDNTEYSASLS
ncbi:MAG TPA: aminotransferase class I/II-fold pyridoxal phosphate-dependent enzyme [Dongiaceae bacterium]|nr:aminotransferase class I/II-fold pyridoxal phosphate-dependent enzyme [Dongiaceae bacterium]